MADILAAADATECETVVVAGFCMGGMYTIKAAATGRFQAGGRLLRNDPPARPLEGSRPGEPLELLAEGDPCPLLAIIGTEDPFTPAYDVAALEATGTVIVSYEGADHGFVHDPVRPAHRAADAADAWARVVEFLSA